MKQSMESNGRFMILADSYLLFHETKMKKKKLEKQRNEKAVFTISFQFSFFANNQPLGVEIILAI